MSIGAKTVASLEEDIVHEIRLEVKYQNNFFIDLQGCRVRSRDVSSDAHVNVPLTREPGDPISIVMPSSAVGGINMVSIICDTV